VVDDEKGARVIFKIILERMMSSAEISLAESGEDALHQLETLVPDLIMVDEDMPTMSGYELIQQVRKMPRVEAIPTLLMIPNGQDVAPSLYPDASLVMIKSGVHMDVAWRIQRLLKTDIS